MSSEKRGRENYPPPLRRPINQKHRSSRLINLLQHNLQRQLLRFGITRARSRINGNVQQTRIYSLIDHIRR